MRITAFQLAERFVGIKEIPGSESNPQILTMLKLDQSWPSSDEVPWCSAFINYIAWLLRLPRSKNLLARSWLTIGRCISIDDATIGFDICIVSRGPLPHADASDLTAQGHVGFYAGRDESYIYLLGGNQSNSVGIGRYDINRLLGIRRLA